MPGLGHDHVIFLVNGPARQQRITADGHAFRSRIILQTLHPQAVLSGRIFDVKTAAKRQNSHFKTGFRTLIDGFFSRQHRLNCGCA
jgi:hypothetical protein